MKEIDIIPEYTKSMEDIYRMTTPKLRLQRRHQWYGAKGKVIESKLNKGEYIKLNKYIG